MENNFFTLIGFEYKKIFKRKSTYLSFLMIAFIITISLFGPIMGDHYIEGVKGINKYEMMDIDRQYSRTNKGYIDENKIADIIMQSKLLLADKENLSSNEVVLLSKDTYEKFALMYNPIMRIFGSVYAPKGKFLDYTAFYKLSADDAKSFYNKRSEKMEEFYSKQYYTDAEIKKYNELNAKINTPFYFDHYEGYDNILKQSSGLSVFTALLVSICIAPIFAGEYSGHTAQLILASKFGKNKLILAKIISSITFSIFASFLVICVSILLNLFVYGFDGANVPLQVSYPLLPYPLTMLGAVIVNSILSIMGILLISMVTMLMSSILKNPFGVIIITNLMLFAPMFIPTPENNGILATIIRLLPVKMFGVLNVFSDHFFAFGNFAFTPYVFLPIFALIICILLIPFSYKAFKNYQVS